MDQQQSFVTLSLGSYSDFDFPLKALLPSSQTINASKHPTNARLTSIANTAKVDSISCSSVRISFRRQCPAARQWPAHLLRRLVHPHFNVLNCATSHINLDGRPSHATKTRDLYRFSFVRLVNHACIVPAPRSSDQAPVRILVIGPGFQNQIS